MRLLAVAWTEVMPCVALTWNFLSNPCVATTEAAFSVPEQTDAREEAPQTKFNNRDAMFCSMYQPI